MSKRKKKSRRWGERWEWELKYSNGERDVKKCRVMSKRKEIEKMGRETRNQEDGETKLNRGEIQVNAVIGG